MGKSVIRVNSHQRGAAMTEYALALALLLVAFLIAGRLLRQKSDERYQNSTRIENGMAPCGGAGGSLSPGECY